jgi:hypothetical protein
VPRSRIGEAEHRVEAETSLIGGCGLLLVLRVDRDQGCVDIDIDRAGSLGLCGALPDLRAHLGDGLGEL